jgi:hypothetical protein
MGLKNSNSRTRAADWRCDGRNFFETSRIVSRQLHSVFMYFNNTIGGFLAVGASSESFFIAVPAEL